MRDIVDDGIYERNCMYIESREPMLIIAIIQLVDYTEFIIKHGVGSKVIRTIVYVNCDVDKMVRANFAFRLLLEKSCRLQSIAAIKSSF